MSFQPVISFVTVARTADSFTTLDATPAGGSTGYGSSNAPANQAAITSVFAQIQAYAEEIVQAASTSGTLAAGLVATVPVRDGVNVLGVLFGENVALIVSSIDSTRTILTTGADYTALLGNVYALSIDGIGFPILIKSVTSTTITLYSALAGTATSYTTAYRYFLATNTQLVTVQGDGKISGEIASFPLTANKCEDIQPALDDIMLKFSAQAAYANQDYAKAHEAARLITANVQLPTTTCATC